MDILEQTNENTLVLVPEGRKRRSDARRTIFSAIALPRDPAQRASQCARWPVIAVRSSWPETRSLVLRNRFSTEVASLRVH